MSADTQTQNPARANRHGDPCPPWCTIDHAKTFTVPGFEEVHHLDAHQGDPRRADGTYSMVRPFKRTSDRETAVVVDGLQVYPENVENLARLIESLAGATPEQLRQLAELIRATAAEVAD